MKRTSSGEPLSHQEAKGGYGKGSAVMTWNMLTAESMKTGKSSISVVGEGV